MGWLKNTIIEKMKKAEEQAFLEGGYISYDPNEEAVAVMAQASWQTNLDELRKRDPETWVRIMKSDLMMQQAMANIMPGMGQAIFPTQTTQTVPQHTSIEKIAMRMRWPSNYHVPENVTIVQAYEVGHANAYVFIIFKDGKTVTLEDEAGLFPNDKLITELRVLGL